MLVRHAMPRRNLPSIFAKGLLKSKAKSKFKACWFHMPSRSPWAVLHTVARHSCQLWDVAILEVNVPRSWLRRTRSGLWCCTRDVPAALICGEVTVGELVIEASSNRGRVRVAG